MPFMHAVTPFLRVPDIVAAIAFFEETLGFRVGFAGGGYAYVHRDGAAFRIVGGEQFPPRGGGRYTS